MVTLLRAASAVATSAENTTTSAEVKAIPAGRTGGSSLDGPELRFGPVAFGQART